MKKFWRSSYFAIILLFIYVPVVIMIVFSFNSGGTVSIWKGATGKNYDAFVQDLPFVQSIVTSLFVAIVATIISVIIGTAAAIGLSKCKSVTQKWWMGIANVPLINADIVTAAALMMLFLLFQVKNFGFATLLAAHVSFDVPYVLITVMPRLKKVDKNMLESAQDLGAKPIQTLFKVILPVLKPAIIMAAAIAFAMSFDDFVISYFTGGPVTNVSTFIYTLKNVKPYIFSFGTILVAAVILIVVIWNVQSAIRTKAKENKDKIRKGYYKQEYMNRINEKLSRYYVKLNERKQIVLSKNPFLWLHYFYLKLLIKLYSIRNFDKKISKLEWRQTKIKNEIRNEKRYYTRLAKVQKSIKALQKDLKKEKLSKAKVKKLNNKMDSLKDKKEYLESEIEWIENRDEKQERKARRITRRIKQLNKEFKAEFDDLTKKDITWYRKKIKDLEEWKVVVEEGKAHYKLRMTTDRLRDLKDVRNNKIFALAAKAKKVKAKIFIWKDLGYKYNRRLNFLRGRNDYLYANALVTKDRYVDRKVKTFEWKIINNENLLTKTNNMVAAKREKYFPSSDKPGRPKNWFQRSWKWIVILFVVAGAFSGLTVGYVKVNTYDLTVGNWGTYIDNSLINEFQKETGLKVNYQTYNSNEDLYQKLRTFKYDIMVPSDYMVQRLAKQNKIQKIDWSNPNLNINDPTKELTFDNKGISHVDDSKNDAKKESIDKSLIKLMSTSPIDKGDEHDTLLNYAVPYFWGDISLVFNTQRQNVKDFLKEELGETNAPDSVVAGKDLNDNGEYSVGKDKQLSWNVITDAVDKKDPKDSKKSFLSQIKLQDDTKNLFMIADEVQNGTVNFKQPGDSTSDWQKKVNDAVPYIKHLVNSSNVTLEGDDMFREVESGQFDVAMMYSGDLLRITRDIRSTGDPNRAFDFSYVRPYTKAEGEKAGERTNVYTDNMTIGSNVKGKTLDAAYKFINFMFREKNAVKNSEAVELASPNAAANQQVIKDEQLDSLGGYEANLYNPIITHTGMDELYNTEPLAYQDNDDVDKYVSDHDPRNI